MGSAFRATVSIEQVRFITPDLATVDGSWTVTGARDADGKELQPPKAGGSNLSRRKTASGVSSSPARWLSSTAAPAAGAAWMPRHSGNTWQGDQVRAE